MQTVRVRTTQNVFIDHPVASVGDRILAYIIDVFAIALYAIGVSMLLIQLEVELWYVWMILLGLPWLFFGLTFEIFMNGQTPGKRVLRIQVVQLDGTTPTIGNYLLRWIFCPVDFSMSGVIAVVCIAWGGKGQRVGDIVAGTAVVKLIRQEEITASEIFVTPGELHVPTFKEVAQLADSDIELVRRAIEASRISDNNAPAEALEVKLKEILKIESDLPTIEFLNTIVKDYSIISEGL